MKISVALRIGFLFLSIAAAGCSSSNASTGPADHGGHGTYVTDPSTMSPPPDSSMMEHLIDSSMFQISKTYAKSESPLSLDDSLTLLVNKAISLIGKYPYVWGGRHVDRATKWVTDNDANGG